MSKKTELKLTWKSCCWDQSGAWGATIFRILESTKSRRSRNLAGPNPSGLSGKRGKRKALAAGTVFALGEAMNLRNLGAARLTPLPRQGELFRSHFHLLNTARLTATTKMGNIPDHFDR
jgi:hypothetical protein